MADKQEVNSQFVYNSNFKCYTFGQSHGTKVRRLLEDCIGGVPCKVGDD